MNEQLENFKSSLAEAITVGGDFDFHAIPIEFDKNNFPPLAEFSLSLPFNGTGVTFVCLPFKDHECTYWCFGDLFGVTSQHFNDLSSILFPLIDGVSQIKFIDMNEDRKEVLSSLFQSTPNIFKVANSANDVFVDMVYPMFQAIEHRPNTIRRVKRSSGVIRRDFEKALLLHNEDLASQYLNEWKSGQRLDAENLQYLNLYMNVKLGKYEYIFENNFERLKDIQFLKMPLTIKHCVSDALFELFLKPCIDLNDWQKVCENFSQERISDLKIFFDFRYIHSKCSFLLSLCSEILDDNTDLETIAWLCSRPELSEIPFVKSVSNEFLNGQTQFDPQDEHEDLEEIGREAHEAFRYLDALKALIRCHPSIKNLRLVADCISNITDMEVLVDLKEDINKFYKNAESTDRQTLRENAPAIYQAYTNINNIQSEKRPISGFENSNAPAGWIEWFEHISLENNTQICRDVFRKYYKTWSVREVVDSPDKSRELLKLFDEAINNSRTQTLIDELFPIFVEVFVLEDENFNENGKELYKEFLQFVSLKAEDIDLQIVTEIESLLFQCNLTNQELSDTIEMLQMAFEKNSSLKNINIFLDTSEQIAFNTSISSPEALKYFLSVANLASRFSQRLDDQQRHTLELLHLDFAQECPQIFLPKDEINDDSDVTPIQLDVKIAIYSLEEQAATRAANYIKNRFPNCSVSVNSDKQCTERLSYLARNADYFVFATRASKHQAFYCVKDKRPSGKEMLMPLGKGTSSILSVLMEQITQN